MKYIFPRQFGLHNVFTSKVDTRETAQPLKDYTFREDEISRVEERKVSRHSRHFESGVEHGAKESVKIPKRLRGMTVELVKKLQIQNQRCPYKELLRHYCPQGVSTKPSQGWINRATADHALVDRTVEARSFKLPA